MAMTGTRRRFLAIAAAFAGGAMVAGSAATTRPRRWRGRALGADAEITLRGPAAATDRALAAARRSLARIERLFSLYDPRSALLRLNRTGWLARPAPDFLDLLRLADRMHRATGGRFDPTIQPLWTLLARPGGAAEPDAVARAAALVDWPSVSFGPAGVRLARPGMALSFNGIAQGYATDQIARVLALEGFADTLVNIGEFRAGRPADADGGWTIGVADPDHGLVETRSVAGTALATSSPAALPLAAGRLGHILNPAAPLRPAMWSTVSVEAAAAAEADAYSTALTLADRPAVDAIAAADPRLRRILLVDRSGTLTVVQSPARPVRS